MIRGMLGSSDSFSLFLWRCNYTFIC